VKLVSESAHVAVAIATVLSALAVAQNPNLEIQNPETFEEAA
jgi:hypothetical protein